jgi:hypothetical protein
MKTLKILLFQLFDSLIVKAFGKIPHLLFRWEVSYLEACSVSGMAYFGIAMEDMPFEIFNSRYLGNLG